MNLASWTILLAAESVSLWTQLKVWLSELYTGTSFFRWIYIALAVAIVALIARILFRKKTIDSVTDVASSLKDEAVSTASSVTDTVSDVTSSVAETASSAVSTTAAAASTVAASSLGSVSDGIQETAKDSIRPMPSIISNKSKDVSWKDRELFAKTRQRLIDQENPVPELLAEDSPVLNGKGLTFGAATSTLAAMLPQSEDSRVTHKRELQKAGYYNPRAWQNLAAIRYIGIIVPLFVFGIMFLFLPARFEWIAAILLVVVPIVGWALPSLFIKGKASDRLSDIETGMPDMLDMMNMCVGQGMTVKESLRRVSTDIKPVYPALAQELSIVHEQSEVGTMRHALENFAERIDTPSVKSFTSLLIQTDEMGTSVSDALEDHSDSMRETLRQRADEKANSSAFKLLFPTVLCLMPAVYMILLGPAIIQLSEFFGQGGFDLINSGRSAIETIETIRQN